jgi:hypothetical protein
MASSLVLTLQNFISSGVTSSFPYSSLKGVEFVALEMDVLWLHTALGNSTHHLPFNWSSRIFLLLRISVHFLF